MVRRFDPHIALVLVAICTLSVAQSPSPNHGKQNTRKPEQQQENRTVAPETPITPSAPLPCCVAQPTTETKPNGKSDNRTYLQRAFAPETLVNWLLFAVGVFGVGFAWKTLRTLIEQTNA